MIENFKTEADKQRHILTEEDRARLRNFGNLPHANPGARATQVGGDHYRKMTIQPWDAMREWLTPEQFEGFLLGCAIKYLARYNSDAPTKGGVMDLKKARHYLDLLIERAEAA